MRWLTKEGRVGTCEADLLARYERFSNESATIVNRALSAVKADVDRAFSDDPRAREELFRLNDLQLFLMQVIAFDGFITRCIHAVGLEGAARRPLLKRIDILASPEVKKRDKYRALRASVAEIARVRNAWAHRLCDEEISDDVRDLTERFGLQQRDGYLWVDLESVAGGGRKVWTFLVCTLQQMAELIWECIEPRLRKGK